MSHAPRTIGLALTTLLAGVSLSAATPTPQDAMLTNPKRAELAQEIETVLWRELDRWFPACIDSTLGGFHQSFDYAWRPKPDNTRALVFQARMTWVAAEVARRRPDHADAFLAYARHGVAQLRKMWDPEYGGFFWIVSPAHQPDPALGDDKHAYGIAFAIYALANYHRAAQDQQALDLAVEAYRWLEKHAKDPDNPGYFEALARNGSLILGPPADNPDAPPAPPPRDRIGTAFGYKSMNSHIHLLEALTSLYHQWPDPQLRLRLEEMLVLVRDRITTPPGCMNLFFTPDWQALPDATSFGHNVETAFLLLEAAEVLGDEQVARTLPTARRLVDHTLRFGYDQERGGIYELGSAFAGVYLSDKVWWSQAEALNAFLLMHDIFGAQDASYGRAFVQTWSFTRAHLIDAEHGGWRWAVDPEGKPIHETDKGTPWKAAYHTGRAMLNCADRLRKTPPR